MIKSVKNLTTQEFTFDKQVLPASGNLILKWNKTNMTSEAFTQILNSYLSGEIDLINDKDKSAKKIKKVVYYAFEKNDLNDKKKKKKKRKDKKRKKKSNELDVAIIKMNHQFNEMMESYIED